VVETVDSNCKVSMLFSIGHDSDRFTTDIDFSSEDDKIGVPA